MKTEAETTVMCLQAKTHQGLPTEARREEGKDPLLETLDEVWPCQHLNFGLLNSNCEKINFNCFKLHSL